MHVHFRSLVTIVPLLCSLRSGWKLLAVATCGGAIVFRRLVRYKVPYSWTIGYCITLY